MRFGVIAFLLSALSLPGFAADSAIPEMLALYEQLGAKNFSATNGKKLWEKAVISKKGDERTCTSCHNKNFSQPGEHKKNGKEIKPMSVKVNSERYTESKKIKKWFKRNCKWTWGRVCTPQEKGDFLVFLQQQ